MRRQRQEAGANSIGFQAGRDVTVHMGLTAAEVLDIAAKVFHDNFLKLTEEAAVQAERRANELLTEFLHHAKDRGVSLEPACRPDVQFALYTAQRDYAVSGQDYIKNLLVDLLLSKFQSKTGELRGIVISEAIETARKLTASQIAALTVHWFITTVVESDVTSIDDLTRMVASNIGALIELVRMESSEYQHIQYSGCATVSNADVGVRLGKALQVHYLGLFQAGTIRSSIPSELWDLPGRDRLFRPSARQENAVEVSAINVMAARELATSLGASEHAQNLVRSMMYSSVVPEAIERELSAFDPIWVTLCEKWKSLISTLNLSTVGVAIAHSNWQRVTGHVVDLATWIAYTDEH